MARGNTWTGGRSPEFHPLVRVPNLCYNIPMDTSAGFGDGIRPVSAGAPGYNDLKGIGSGGKRQKREEPKKEKKEKEKPLRPGVGENLNEEA